tara:strand:+ start:5402 stop:7549 length:2148 start_codon:yes stop_codon:yes gene_type:complete
MKNRLFIISLFTLCLVKVSFGQKNTIKNAQKEYDNLSYIKIIEQLSSSAEVGKDDTKTLLLANSYYFNGQMREASRWYKQLLSSNEEALDKEIYFRYAQSLKAVENYSESDSIMKKFIKSNPEDSRSKLFNINYLQVIDLLSEEFPLRNLEINTSFSDFGTSIYNGNLIFASSRNKKNKLYNWNDQPFLDIFQFDKEGNITEITGKVNTKYHESSTAFTKDGKTIYFTRNSSRKNDKNIIGLKIHKATFRDEKWRDIESLPFNSDDYNVAHPTLSIDETKLYFTSDMPGTIGSSDIFLVNINKDGTFGTPQNLGIKINTEGRENFPFVSDNGTLYFSSDSHIGLGGLDIFKFNNINNLSNSKEVATNIGKPINSPKDDFGYLINEVSLNGYFTSNRPGGKGDDDIYSFTRNPCEQYVKGVIVDKNTLESIPNADVTVYDQDNITIKVFKSDINGSYALDLACDFNSYKLIGEKENYENDTLVFTNSSGKIKDLKLILKPTPQYTSNEKDELTCPHYSIIAGSFSNKSNAERKIKSLISEGYDAAIAEINPEGLFRAAYGRFKSKSKAIKLLYHLKYTLKKEAWFLIEDNTAFCEDFELKHILYDFDKSNIRPDAELELIKIIKYMNEFPKVKVVLLSHTDSRGDQPYNLALSMRRNKSATEYLVNKGGISEERITVENYGETKLINECPNGEICNEFVHQDNRRTEFVFINELNN